MADIVLLNFNIFNGYKQVDNCDKKIDFRLEGSVIIKQSAEPCCHYITVTGQDTTLYSHANSRHRLQAVDTSCSLSNSTLYGFFHSL